ncbi:hypothetical protein [Photorhabdus asymbiotica]|uniref:Uncharacterized protein n=2 Tax=Photorhabdus asymbiotica TaxID=291112 RepID=B6VK59_PHOAA|nr:hypothetical protein [Photorhabdus asymbiotica]RKS66912.1 hypothetical protein BDD30_1260 [Photorhabdus asymbiotica]CAQ83119.1 conserved hypothetical protein [Photorhabdus asymbiotica]CAR66539.1 Conserved Hypothetical Protein [Photorhabdus asymbiotica subsp. asymbiotica ATCC 43949]
MKKCMLGALLLGIAFAANAGSGADKSIELTDQECIAKWDMSSASRSCDALIWKIGDTTCAITALCRVAHGPVVENGTRFFPYSKVSQLVNCDGYLKTYGC